MGPSILALEVTPDEDPISWSKLLRLGVGIADSYKSQNFGQTCLWVNCNLLMESSTHLC